MQEASSTHLTENKCPSKFYENQISYYVHFQNNSS